MFKCTIKPNKISIRNTTSRHVVTAMMDKKVKSFFQEKAAIENFKKSKSSFCLSRNSKTKLLDTINFIYSVSKPRNIEIGSKQFYNFKCSFVTLTLPSDQIHSDVEIKKCLNLFLNNIRTIYKLNNYVWKCELQSNGNLHFHFVWDLFIHHKAVRYYWNKAINSLGYIDRYHAKFSQMSLSEYAKYRNQSVNDSIDAYVYGKRSNWKSPGTENVKMIKNVRQLSAYLAKYLLKAQSGISDENLSPEVLSRLESFGRSWSRSQSLSKIKYITNWVWDSIKPIIKDLSNNFKDSKIQVYDYCSVFYLNYKSPPNLVKWFQRHMQELALTYQWNYP